MRHTAQKSCLALPLSMSGMCGTYFDQPTGNKVLLCSDSVLHAEDLAAQGVRIKEEQIRREEEKVFIIYYVGRTSV